jgi:hypothetical protein
MIFIDIDGVCIDFIGTAAKFGIELKPNKFDKWEWINDYLDEEGNDMIGNDGVTPENFYAKAELQKWFVEMILNILASGEKPIFITQDFADIKQKCFIDKTGLISENVYCFNEFKFIEATDKAEHCLYPFDVLIDDNAANCEAWRKRGGIAYHFDLSKEKPFENLLK